MFCLTLCCSVIFPNINTELKNKQNAHLLLDSLKPKLKGLSSSLEEVTQMTISKTSAHLQFPSCYRLSCEMQLNLVTPWACRPGLRNSRKWFLVGCEALLFYILLEVLGIWLLVFFWHVWFLFHLKPMKRRSEHRGEDTISENSQYGLKMIILAPSLKKKKEKISEKVRVALFSLWLKKYYLRAGRNLSFMCESVSKSPFVPHALKKSSVSRSL